MLGSCPLPILLPWLTLKRSTMGYVSSCANNCLAYSLAAVQKSYVIIDYPVLICGQSVFYPYSRQLVSKK